MVHYSVCNLVTVLSMFGRRIQWFKQEGQHLLTGQRAASFRLLANQ